jgi:hypothetical protein
MNQETGKGYTEEPSVSELGEAKSGEPQSCSEFMVFNSVYLCCSLSNSA